jgi:predicted TIM-barrel fold metal-dependent hydrolase
MIHPSRTASPHTLPTTSWPYIKPAIPIQQPGSSTAGSLYIMTVYYIMMVNCHFFRLEDMMRTIALEEHYATEAFMDGPWRELKAQAEAARDHPRVAAGYDGLIRRLCDLGEGRISEMEAAGVDVQVLSLTSPGVEQLDAEQAVSLAREANEALAEATRRHPGSFAGFAAVPTAAPEAAAEELERAVREHGFIGALINGHTGGALPG